MMDFTEPLSLLISLLTLTFLEIILGIDNLVFISIVSARLKPEQRSRVRRFGLLLALITRLLFLASILWLTARIKPLFELLGHAFSIRDLLLIAGGLFLLVKSTQEIHNEFADNETNKQVKQFSSPVIAVIQIVTLDIVFSLDSIFTAVALTHNFYVMAAAISIAMLGMIYLSDYLSKIIHENPSIKMLALSFLLLIGTALVADGLGFEIPRPYIYFSICFSLFVEFLNNLKRAKRK